MINCSKEDEDQQSRRERRYELRVGTSVCPSCGHESQPSIHDYEEAGEEKVISLHDLPGLPAGVKFDPTDQELLEHLDGKVKSDVAKLHPLLDEFIPLIPGEEGICYTHPEKLPGVSMGGYARHFFHYPSKAYTTGTRKRRKVQTDEDGSETRWHKTGKTRPIFVGGKAKGHKKILVLYTNYGRLKKPQKTNWVMHQYHLGSQDQEREGELVVSKVFYQTHPRQCGGGVSNKFIVSPKSRVNHPLDALIDGYDSVSVKTTARINQMPSTQLTPTMTNLQLDTSSYIG